MTTKIKRDQYSIFITNYTKKNIILLKRENFKKKLDQYEKQKKKQNKL